MGSHGGPRSNQHKGPSRRHYLSTLVVGCLTSLAGCSGSDGGENDDGGSDDSSGDDGGESDTQNSDSTDDGDVLPPDGDSPNATYPPADDQPLIGYDETVKTGEGNVEGSEVEVEVTIEFYYYDILHWQFGVGAALIPLIELDDVPLLSMADKSISENMSDPEERAEIMQAVGLNTDIADGQTDAWQLETRTADGTDVFDRDVTLETWITTDGERSVLLEMVRGPLNLGVLDTSYDGEVTFATSIHRVYDERTTGDAEPGSTIPASDVQTAQTELERLLSDGLVILEDPQAEVITPSFPVGSDLSPPEMTVTYDPPDQEDLPGYIPFEQRRLEDADMGTATHWAGSVLFEGGDIAANSHGSIGMYEMVPADSVQASDESGDPLPFVDVKVADDGSWVVTLTCEGETHTINLGTPEELIDLFQNKWLDLVLEAIDRWIGHLKSKLRDAKDKLDRFRHTGGGIAETHREHAKERIEELEEKLEKARSAKETVKTFVEAVVAKLRGEEIPDKFEFVFESMPREQFVMLLMVMRLAVDEDFMDDIPDAWKVEDPDCHEIREGAGGGDGPGTG